MSSKNHIVAATVVICLWPFAVAAQSASCKFLCAPTLLFEPTITIENVAGGPRVAEGEDDPEREPRETVFEAIVALDVPTTVPRLSFTLEAIVHPFVKTDENPFTGRTADEAGGDVRDNPIEIESEINLQWLGPEQTGGWVSSHFDVVDQFSPASRPRDRSVYTHKLDFELDTAFAVFQRLPESHWLHDVEIEASLDYLATGVPKKGDVLGATRYLDDASHWSFSVVFVIPVIKGN